MNEIFQGLIDAKKVSDVTNMLEKLQETNRVAWRPVGDRENNLATINIGSDPASGLIERITNAIDAFFEKEWILRGEPTNLRSPRIACEQWFGIEDGKLENITTVNQEIRDLAGNVKVTLFESERPEKPTVDIRDYGIGIKSEDFSKSILSLNENRKLKKFFLAGAFGQGGSTTLSYSPYTMIFSKYSFQDSGSESKVAFSLVRFNQGNFDTDKHGVYEYLINHSTGQPFEFEVEEENFPSGTLVRHVAMDLGKYRSNMTVQQNSLWYLTHHFLFDPVMPYTIEEQRENPSKGATRTVTGNYRLLEHGENTEYKRKAELTFRNGQVKLSWWVISADGTRDRIKQYVLPSQPIILTYNGQKQGHLPNTIIKNDLKLPYLDRYLIVHIDCDNLDGESRRQLFPTTRESLRDTSLLDDLRLLIKDTLSGDDELKRLDRERKQRFIERVDSQSVENIRRRLADRVSQVISSGGSGHSPRTLPPDGGGQVVPDRPPIPVQEPPTMLEIIGSGPKHVYSGKRFFLRFKTDADPSYFMNPDAFIAVINPPSFGQYSGTTTIREGYGITYFTANDQQEPGTTSEISLELRPRTSRSLSSSIEAEIVPLPEDLGTDRGKVGSPNINPIWVTSDAPFWHENEWDENSVAKVIDTEESIDIFVSSENKNLNSLITKAQRTSTEAVDTIKDFYLEHIAFHSFLSSLKKERMSNENNNSEEVVDDTIAEKFHQQELERACLTICGIMSQLFNYLIAES